MDAVYWNRGRRIKIHQDFSFYYHWNDYSRILDHFSYISIMKKLWWRVSKHRYYGICQVFLGNLIWPYDFGSILEAISNSMQEKKNRKLAIILFIYLCLEKLFIRFVSNINSYTNVFNINTDNQNTFVMPIDDFSFCSKLKFFLF